MITRTTITQRHNRKWRSMVAFSVLTFLVTAMSLQAAPPNGKGGGKGGGTSGGGSSGYQPELRILWKVDLDAHSSVRPAVGPDGRVYAVDSTHTLHIVSPDGTQHARVPDAGRKGLDIDPVDGTVYTGNENHVKAFDRDGNEHWTFIQNPRAFVFSALGVGPDRNVYGVASSGMGVFSLDRTTGTERWRSVEIYDRSNASFTALDFGPGAEGDQLYFRANAATRSLKLDGTDVFKKYIGGYRPVVSPFDGSWHFPAAAFDSDGDLLWEFTGFPTATGGSQPVLGVDGTHYTVNQGFRMFAIDPEGNSRWIVEMDEGVGVADVDPSDAQLILPTGTGYTSPAALKAVSTANGSDLWRVELPWDLADYGLRFISTGLAFSPDWSTAYVITDVAGGTAELLAVSLDPSLPNASTWLRSQEIALTGRSNRKGVTMNGAITVLDENRAPVPGATVRATWTDSYDASLLVTQEVETGGDGTAKFSVQDDGGIYTLTVNDIAKADYTFDPDHSLLSGGLAKF